MKTSRSLLPIFPLVGYIIWDTFFNAKKNYSIELDFSGIKIADQYFMWHEIQQTAILQFGFGRNETDYLVVIFNDGSYHKFNLAAFASFWNFKNTIAAYIEHFRNENHNKLSFQ